MREFVETLTDVVSAARAVIRERDETKRKRPDSHPSSVAMADYALARIQAEEAAEDRLRAALDRLDRVNTVTEEPARG